VSGLTTNRSEVEGTGARPGPARLPLSTDPRGWRSISLRPASWPNLALAAALVTTLIANWIVKPPAHLDAKLALGGLAALIPFLLIPWRPRIPEGLLGASVGCGILAAILGVASGPDVVAPVAVYTIGTKRTGRETLAAIGVAWLGAFAAGLLDTRVIDPVDRILGYATVLVLLGAVGWLGLSIGRRRAYMRGLVDRAEDLERERVRLERERQELAREAVADERARIARELHDVVAHHVSVMVIQAGAAQATLPADAQATGQALEAIRQTGREALAEMRRMLGLLRSDAAAVDAAAVDAAAGTAARTAVGETAGTAAETAAGQEALAPQPALSDLDALADRMREAGLIVDLEPGQPRRLPPGVDLSAYRIVQEALTNALRHAGRGAHVRVGLDYGPVSLAVEVVDDGRGRRGGAERSTGVGHGLVGMRERVALFDGTLEAGPRVEGGFRIRAQFPLEAAPASDAAPETLAPPQEAQR
jgi:signal transduction histidine kinase